MTTQDPELSAALGWPGGISDPVLDRKVLLQMVAAMRLASQQALEALYATERFAGHGAYPADEVSSAITALRAALAQQAEPVEPVAWYQKRGQEVLTSHPACWGREEEPWTPLYTAPPQRKLVPLTEEEIMHIGMTHQSLRQVVRAVERAHGIKE